MIDWIKKIVGTKNEREIKRIRPYVGKINDLEAAYERLSDADLGAKTQGFKERISDATTELRRELEEAQTAAAGAESEERDEVKGRVDELDKELREKEAEVLEELLPEAFAAVREASRRTIGLRHFDVQLIGGTVLHEGKIAEMKTGEGKTLVATLPLYLNALTGRGVHLITVNDYLARRDVQWMGPIYHKLGLTVASIVHEASYLFDPTFITKDYRYLNLRPISRQEAYLADITYGTNNEFGFDYLRDNMKFSLEEYVQRELNYAVVDEVDNILIDEARTPLIISGPAEESTDKYYLLDRMIPKLQRGAVIQGDPSQEERAAIDAKGDYTVDEKSRSVTLTEGGVAKVERLLGVHNLYDPRQIDTLHHVQQALKAHAIFKRDVDYVVKDGEVIIVDEFTGRLMPGRRWSDGLHQAVEAKERVHIREENQTLATITIQNYFRMYKKARGHDRHRRYRGARVQKDLQARRDGGADPPRDGAPRSARRGVSFGQRKVRRGGAGDRGAQPEGTANSRRHHVGGEVGADFPHAQEKGHQAQCAQRRESRSRGEHHRAGRPLQGGDDRDQHGRARHRYSARRQRRVSRALGHGKRMDQPRR